MEPTLAGRGFVAASMPNHGYISDPPLYIHALTECFQSLGGTVITAKALNFVIKDNKVNEVQTTVGSIECSSLVITAGIWSGSLANKLHLNVPLESERGYHIELINPSFMPKSPIMFASKKFIATPMGGVLSVVWTDLIQGIIVVLFGALFYYFAFAPIGWSITELGNRLTIAAGPEYWSFSHISTSEIIVQFITGSFGVFAAQVYWQRCFAAKDPNTARTAMLLSEIFVVTAVSLTALVGMMVKSMNPDLEPALVMPWFMMNHLPLFVVSMVFALILAAAMSSADSLLNAAAIIFVNDIIRPFKPELTDRDLVAWTKKSTVIIGISTYAAFEPEAAFPTSGIFRAGVAAFTKLFSDKYASENIRMNNVLPGFTDSLPEKQIFRDRIPMQRYARTSEIADVVAFLASDGATYITGQNIRVDGGMSRSV